MKKIIVMLIATMFLLGGCCEPEVIYIDSKRPLLPTVQTTQDKPLNIHYTVVEEK